MMSTEGTTSVISGEAPEATEEQSTGTNEIVGGEAAAPPGRTKRLGSGRARWAGVIAALAVVGASMFFVGRWTAGSDEPTVGAGVPSAAETTTTLPDATADRPATGSTGTVVADPGQEPVAEVAAALGPSVVQLETPTGLGSGVIYRQDGYILTAAHVVAGSDRVSVRLADGEQLDGRVIGTHPDSDVAVVKTEGDGLQAAPLATGVELRLGQMAIAIGSPWGLDQTVTAGVVSSVRRAVPGPDGVVRNLIQTDAPINPGNSGGALADRTGQVIGINDSIVTTTGSNGGVGFAIPIDTAVSIADRLVAGEGIGTAYLGVTGTEPTRGPAGALITGVIPGSSADEAGLLRGDLVTAFEGQPVTSFLDLAGYIRSVQPGDRVTLTLIRGDQEQTVSAVLDERTE